MIMIKIIIIHMIMIIIIPKSMIFLDNEHEVFVGFRGHWSRIMRWFHCISPCCEEVKYSIHEWVIPTRCPIIEGGAVIDVLGAADHESALNSTLSYSVESIPLFEWSYPSSNDFPQIFDHGREPLVLSSLKLPFFVYSTVAQSGASFEINKTQT